MKEFIFTFGFDHKHPDSGRRLSGCYTVVEGEDAEDARNKMMAKFGTKWAFQYVNRQQAGVKKYNLQQVQFNDRILRVVK